MYKREFFGINKIRVDKPGVNNCFAY